MRVFCTPDPKRALGEHHPPDSVGVVLYGPPSPDVGAIGNRLLHIASKWESRFTQRAWDFLSIALAVTAADTFVRRDLSPDGWARELDLVVAVREPAPWMDVTEKLTKALRFLSGDYWCLRIIAGGKKVPHTRRRRATEHCVCLFSGGIDSLIGAIDLIAQEISPILVSYAYPKEGRIQRYLAETIGGTTLRHFCENANPRWEKNNEVSMRTRSIIFIAYGVLVASGLLTGPKGDTVKLFMPENGYISLNPPLTPRRIGSLSTRTTHLYFISTLQSILQQVDLPVTIVNPYWDQTKGEMLDNCRNPKLLRDLIDATISCGKWKRRNMQCGRCVPCIIRRAAYHAAGIPDNSGYEFFDLSASTHDDDVLAFRTALIKSRSANMKRWLFKSGPLIGDSRKRQAYVDVFRRGLKEIDDFLSQTF